jgi:hypothetical protein
MPLPKALHGVTPQITMPPLFTPVRFENTMSALPTDSVIRLARTT